MTAAAGLRASAAWPGYIRDFTEPPDLGFAPAPAYILLFRHPVRLLDELGFIEMGDLSASMLKSLPGCNSN